MFLFQTFKKVAALHVNLILPGKGNRNRANTSQLVLWDRRNRDNQNLTAEERKITDHLSVKKDAKSPKQNVSKLNPATY